MSHNGKTDVGKGMDRRNALKMMGLGLAGLTAGGAYLSADARRAVAASAPKEPYKVAVVAFSTGPAASYGYPAHEIMEIMVERLNAGGGLLGRKVVLSKDDEGAVAKVVETFKRLTQQDKVDAILGLASSGNALAAAPVAEESKTIFINTLARSYKVTWQNPDDPTKFRNYVFKSVNDTVSHAASAALGVAKLFPGAKVAHVHPDYAYGHEIKDIFDTVIKKMDPKAETVAELWPKLFTPDYSPHIAKILTAKPTIVFNSFWGADSTRFADQCIQRGVLKRSKMCGDHGEFYSTEKRPLPKELIGSMPFPVEGLPTVPDPKRWPLNQLYYDLYYKKHKNTIPAGAAFTAQGFLSLISAIERAAALVGGWPNSDQISAAFRGLAAATPLGWLAYGEDGKSSQPKWAGLLKEQPPYAYGIDNIYHIPMEEICAPPGVDPMEWVQGW